MTSEPPRLLVDDVDLAGLVLARNDVHPEGDWWFDPRTGVSLYYGVDDTSDLPALVEGVHVLVPREPQPKTDVEDFFDVAAAAGVPDETLAELWRAFRGRGGLRRFRELVGRTEAGPVWADFTLERESARAVDWLESRGLIDPASASRWRDARQG